MTVASPPGVGASPLTTRPPAAATASASRSAIRRLPSAARLEPTMAAELRRP